MKTFSSKIPSYDYDSIFTPVRSKIDYIRILLTSMKLLLIGGVSGDGPRFKVIIDKMSRLFIYNDGKYFSVSFPFTINTVDNLVTTFTSFGGREIDSRVVSEVNSILLSEQFLNTLSLLDYYIEPNDISFDSIYLLEELFMIEPAYMRYDFDAENENGELHPLHHLDLHYSQYGTLKIGLPTGIEFAKFEDIHDTKTNCIYLNL